MPRGGKSRHAKNHRARIEASPAPPDKTRRPRDRVLGAAAIVLLIAIACVAYFNAGHEELFFDSAANDFIKNPQTMDLGAAFRRVWQAPLAADSPLAHLTFSLNCAVNRALGWPPFKVLPFLIANVAVHAVNVCLVYFLLRALLVRVDPRRSNMIGLPLAAAIIFAVHPMHASSVAYIAQRRGLLAAMFYLLAVLAYLRIRPDSALAGGVRRWTVRRLALAASIPLCYWLGFLSKSMAVTLPLALLATELCLRAPDRPALRRYLRYLGPAMILCVLLGLAAMWAGGLFDPQSLSILPYGGRPLHSPWTHFLTETRVFAQYWKLLLLPLPAWMCIDHTIELSRNLLDKLALLALLLHLLLLGAGLAAALRGWTLAAIGIFWFYITLLPYAIVPEADLFVEYKTYLASVGLILIVAEVVRRIYPAAFVAGKLVVAAVVVVALLLATLSRNVIYQSQTNLWADAVAKYPNHPRPQNNLAAYLVENRQFDEAIAHCKQALKAAPDFVHAHVTLGQAYAGSGRLDEAIAEYREAVRLNPGFLPAHYNLGNALLKKKSYVEAITEYEAARSLDPHYLKAYIMCAQALYAQGRYDEAIMHLRSGIQEARPDEDRTELALARFNLANTLSLQDEDAAAIEEYHTVLALDPKYVKAYFGLGLIFERQGRPEEAMEAYLQALAIKPDYQDARQALNAVQANPNRLKDDG